MKGGCVAFKSWINFFSHDEIRCYNDGEDDLESELEYQEYKTCSYSECSRLSLIYDLFFYNIIR